MIRNMYSRDGFSILCACTLCGRVNYVEQHGTTAKCKCSPEWTEHQPIPYQYRDAFGARYVGPTRLIIASPQGALHALREND